MSQSRLTLDRITLDVWVTLDGVPTDQDNLLDLKIGAFVLWLAPLPGQESSTLERRSRLLALHALPAENDIIYN